MKFKVEGIISAMVTPFTKGGEFVDFDKVAPLAAYLEKSARAASSPAEPPVRATSAPPTSARTSSKKSSAP